MDDGCSDKIVNVIALGDCFINVASLLLFYHKTLVASDHGSLFDGSYS